jgi:hypothetical protein
MLPEVRSQVTYFLALHEIAHCLLHRTRRVPRLTEEAEAWEWALGHAVVDPSPATARSMYRKLGSYLSNYVAKNDRAGRAVRVIPPAGDPIWDTFDALVVLAGWAARPRDADPCRWHTDHVRQDFRDRRRKLKPKPRTEARARARLRLAAHP